MAVLTIRDVPEPVKETLARDARDSGKSLQAFLLDVLTRQADFSRNRRLLLTISHDLKFHGGAGAGGTGRGRCPGRGPWSARSFPYGRRR